MRPQTTFTAAGSVLILDQVSKYLVTRYGPLQLNQISLEAWINTAGPFSLPLSNTAAAALTAAILITLVYVIEKKKKSSVPANIRPFGFWSAGWRMNFGFALLLGGGLSNLVDRAFHGGVVDIIHFHTASANLADVCIVAGFSLLALSWPTSRSSHTNESAAAAG